MAYSYEVTPADGVNANFTIPFNYLIRAHIFVEVDGVSATFTFVDDYNITLDAVPTVGQLVRVMRVTPIDSAYIDFKDGSTLGESDLDLSAEHLLYCVQEAIDTVDSKLGSNSVLNWDALSKRIVNLADPIPAESAVPAGPDASVRGAGGVPARGIVAIFE